MGTFVGAGIIAIMLGALISWRIWQNGRWARAKAWPTTEATIQSGGMEVVSQSRSATVTLPCFAFSYAVNGEYQSGRFSLSVKDEVAERLTRELIDRKLRVHFDPAQPSRFYLPYETIEGCPLEQPLKPHFVRLYPKD